MQVSTQIDAQFDNGWDCQSVAQTLGSASHILLVAHQHADGDAVGSLTGMAALLHNATQANITMLLPDGCPDDLLWLPTAEAILDGQAHPKEAQQAIAQADLILFLDLNTLARTGHLAPLLQQSTAKRMLIDHHLEPDREAFQLLVSEPSISSTCELVYWLMSTTFGPDIFTATAATCLYAGICTDTGTFSYSNHRTSLYLAAANLLAFGINPADINLNIRNVFTTPRLRFFGHAIDRLLTVYPQQHIALMVIPSNEMETYGVDSADLTGLINEVMRLREVDCAILIREEADCIRLSFRSKQHHDVSRMARELFGGGGHERAAGATSHLSLSETVATVKRHLLLLLLPLLLLINLACRPTPVVDLPTASTPSFSENIINANRYIAGTETTQIEAYLARRQWQATRLDNGVYLRETSTGNRRPISYGDTLSIEYTVETLGGNPIYTHRTDTLCVGRLQPNRGLDFALRSLHHRGAATVIIPSEQAFGVVGDGNRIGTRMVLIYHLKINN